MALKYDPILGAMRQSDVGVVSGNFVTIDNTNGINSINGIITNDIAGGLNVQLGFNATNSKIIGNDCVAIGSSALKSQTGGHDNIAIGQSTLGASDGGNSNIAIGEFSMLGNVYGSKNIGIGYHALQSADALYNISIGKDSAINLLTGENNIVIGTRALLNNINGYNNIVIASAIEGNAGVEVGDIANDISGAVQIGIGLNSTSDTFQYENNRIADVNGLAITQGNGISISKATSGLIISNTLTAGDAGVNSVVHASSANWNDITFNPNIITKTVGETVTSGSFCYLKSDGWYYKANALSAITMPAVAIAYDNITSGSTGRLLRQGDITNSTWNFTVGGMIYVSDVTAGSGTNTVPVSSLHQVQCVGYATAANSIYFNPQLLVMELT